MSFMYTGVMYSGKSYSEFVSTSGKLKSMPDHSRNRTYDLCNTRPNDLPTELRVQVGDIPKLNPQFLQYQRNLNAPVRV